jgi:hypothetical protein
MFSFIFSSWRALAVQICVQFWGVRHAIKPHTMYFPHILRGGVISLILALLFSCTKDQNTSLPDPIGSDSNVHTLQPISLVEAMHFFSKAVEESSGTLVAEDQFIEMSPLWHLASTGVTMSGREVISVPLPDSALVAENQGRVGARLLFGKTAQGEITADVVVHLADSAYQASNQSVWDFSTFSGIYAFFDLEQRFKYAMQVDSGVLVAGSDSITTSTITTSEGGTLDRSPCFAPYTFSVTVCRVAFMDPCVYVTYTMTVHVWICSGSPTGGGGGGSGNPNGGDGPGGGISSHNNNINYWNAYLQNLPTNYFSLEPNLVLPPGFDLEVFQKLVEIVNGLELTDMQFASLLSRPGWVSAIHTAFKKNIPEARIKAVLDFAIAHNLTEVQLRALLLNGALFEQVEALAEGLNLNQSDVGFLIAQPSLVAQITSFLQGHAGNDPAKVFAEYVIKELRTDPSIPSNTDLSQYNFFDNFDPVINYLEANTESEDEINNGIDIDYMVQAPSPSPPPAGRLLGGAPENPNGGQDAIGRTNGDINILPSHIREFDNYPEWDLKLKMKFLFFMGTNGDVDEILDEKGDEVKNAYLNKFFGNKNGTFHKYQNSTLHLLVKESKKFKNWLKSFGRELNKKLNVTNGNILGVNNIETNGRIVLNDTKSLTILINDTQKTDVYIVNDQYDFDPVSGAWEAVIRVNVTDNFGVDDGDVTEFWNHFPGGPGFVSWWVLQHRKNYWPFMTDLWFSVKIKGNINNP